jgi:hypothetical protein
MYIQIKDYLILSLSTFDFVKNTFKQKKMIGIAILR